MKQSVPVSDIMTKDVVTLHLTDSLTDAEVLFKKHHIRHIPVIKGTHIQGMLSYTIPSNATVREAAEFLVSKEFHALPVVEGEDLVGIVTTTDIIRHYLKHY